MFQKINEARPYDMEKRKVYDMELKGGGGDISELDDILKCFFGWAAACTTCSSLAIWAEGRGGGNGSSI
jgi:hypothetical protein